LIILSYTILTGLRPSGIRAAVMVGVICGAIILRRRPHLANSFTLAIIAVLIFNPTDLFNLGCQLSFLCVFVLLWGIRRWFAPQPLTPLERLIADARPTWLARTLQLWHVLQMAYFTTILLGLVTTPLLLKEYNLISLGGIVIGPPIVLLTSVALVAGFLLMLLGGVFEPLGTPFALLAEWSLRLASSLVKITDAIPYTSLHFPTLPDWWTWLFYTLLVTLVTVGSRLRVFVLALIGWLILGLLLPLPKNVPDELRITVLAVGKGGCIVMECPDGRCLVYDVGTASGPNTVSRVIAPFLWKRGISRIDELFISHADTDHFNGVSQLLNRFPVGQVTLTPSFSEKPTIEVAATLNELERAGVPKRITSKGDLFKAGKVELEVLHPPLEGPAGIENERSLVLLVSYQNHTVLLTGDLEKAGTSILLQQASRPVDVLIAPHHGSRTALPQTVLNWCQPRFIVVSRGAPYGNTIQQGPDTKQITTWDTDTQGAVTIRCHRTGVTVESFRTQERQVISRARR
jgi:competence protein ComEC